MPNWISDDGSISGRDLILIFGGMFLIAKSTREINHEMEGDEETLASPGAKKVNVRGVIVQIVLLDIIFSFDSILTAVGLTPFIIIMIFAVIASIGIMIIFSGKISDFIHKHPSLKMLALSFLMLIGCALVAEGFHKEIPKGYIYFAMAFSVFVELINLRVRAKSAPVKLHQSRP